MEELDLPYELKTYKRGANGIAPPEMKQIHPLGKSPVVSFSAPDTPQHTIAESSVIFEYLLDHFQGQKLIPERYVHGKEGQPGGETDAWMRYRYYMHYTEGSFTPLLVTQILMNSKFVDLYS
jgi:glutathione S-transferase